MSEKRDNEVEECELPKEKSEEIESQFSVIDKRKVGGDSDEISEKTFEKKLPTFIEELQKNLENAEKQLGQYISGYKKILDDQENYKARIKKENEATLIREKVGFIRDFLEIIDNLERCKDSCDTAEGNLLSFKDGLKLIIDQFANKLKAHGVQRVNPLGEKFDPARDEAITVRETDDPEIAGLVVEVIDFGYKLNSHLIRPAKVIVGKLKEGIIAIKEESGN